MTLKFDEWPKKNKAPLLYYTKLCASFQIHRWIQTGVTVRKCSIWVKVGDCLPYMTLKNLMDHLENNRANLLYSIKFCAAFQSHWYIQTGVTVRKRSIRVKIGDLFVPRDLENWRMTLKTIGHLFYTPSSGVHHFKSINEVKLALQSGNAPFGSKLTIFFCPVWLWKLTDDLEKL